MQNNFLYGYGVKGMGLTGACAILAIQISILTFELASQFLQRLVMVLIYAKLLSNPTVLYKVICRA